MGVSSEYKGKTNDDINRCINSKIGIFFIGCSRDLCISTLWGENVRYRTPTNVGEHEIKIEYIFLNNEVFLGIKNHQNQGTKNLND